jgi:4-diphosphocytidyl-2-C-methyl-D-erythritol kinase
MLPIRLFDTLRVERVERAGIEIRVVGGDAGSAVPAGPDNLAVRGAAAACRALGLEPRLRIELSKRIPVAAGLGGGSSDAAAALRAVEQLEGRQIPPAERCELARAIGADVPFFLEPRPAIARGVGEQLEALAGGCELWWTLVALPFPVLTADVYRAAASELTLPRPRSSIASLLALAALASPPFVPSSEHEPLAERLGNPDPPQNDLERVTRRRHPEVGAAQQALREVGARVTGMSGSGPTVYGNFADRAAAEQALARATLPAGARGWVVSSPASDLSGSCWGVAKR